MLTREEINKIEPYEGHRIASCIFREKLSKEQAQKSEFHWKCAYCGYYHTARTFKDFVEAQILTKEKLEEIEKIIYERADK